MLSLHPDKSSLLTCAGTSLHLHALPVHALGRLFIKQTQVTGSASTLVGVLDVLR